MGSFAHTPKQRALELAKRYNTELNIVRKCGDLLIVTYSNGIQVVRVYDSNARIRDRDRFPGGERVIYHLSKGTYVIVVYEYKRSVVGITLYTC